ncbi:MAG: proton-conducting transporter membrane subunit, partial [Vicinamibacterales bacterium]
AFAGVSHAGLAVLGLFALNIQGLQGALFLMLSFGIVASSLFCLTGFLHVRIGSSDISAFGGLARQLPRLAAFFFLIGLASIGTPGTIGFHGEFLVLLGAFQAQWQFAALAVLGVILSAAYFLWYYERAFFGPVTNKAVSKLQDLTPRETIVGLSAAGLILWIGFYPAPVLNITGGSIEALAKRLEEASVAKSVQPGPLPLAHVIRQGGAQSEHGIGLSKP